MSDNWWDKFLNLFTEEVEEEQEPPRKNQDSIKPHSAEKRTLSQDRRSGRIEEGHRPVQPRMINQYSQQSSTRKRAIEDRRGQIQRKPKRNRESLREEKVNSAPPKERRVRRQRPIDKEQHVKDQPPEKRRRERLADSGRKEEVREKFAGVNFRAADVPSPVYGFRKRGDIKQNQTIDREEPADFGQKIENEPSERQQEIPIESIQNHKEEPTENKTERQSALEEKTRISRQIERPAETRSTSFSESNIAKTRTRNLTSSDETKDNSEEPSKRIDSLSKGSHSLPPLSLLTKVSGAINEDVDWIESQQQRLSETLQHFNVNAKVIGYTNGPAVTRFELQPAPGEKVSKIKKLNDDLKLSLAVKDIRIEAPIPGTNSIGIEIPNQTSQPVFLREMIESREFQESDSPLTAALGRDIAGKPIVTDLRKMPHGLIGGATGSGKSVCINSLLISLLYKASPEEVKFLLIDPKVVELAPFKEIPHLAAPVINDAKEAALALKWAVEEMERRYGLFVDVGARDISRYNSRAASDKQLPFIVIVIDELADLMMAAPQDVEESICRIAQKARACGIHLVLATQRPSVDVITGLIKANIPTRLAFSVSAQADSRTILDIGGAEKLLGHGDMLFVENGSSQSVRVQGNFVSDDEIDNITEFVKQHGRPNFLFEKEQLQSSQMESEADDELFEEACFFVFEQGSASASSLQRKFRIGYNRAARLIDLMEGRGMISGSAGSKPRDVLISEEEFLENLIKDS